ncbi:sulfite exporter TauE/SafE family protein [Aliarcobacter cibarius]|uniref:Probable membrane transporter protein n=1 Tax=Aliarcobacter cibarius TaxID=255507 RepID=A0A5J6RLW9_9BACT|nr:sulfite exporter TauE/SafE family protein [Aliarcobacter cibarius]QEZ89431.1 sulfite exporter TauE/SafE family protein [Aliarcobacter cibarius]QKJ27430.1 sulfite exporter TauE/SafE family protein [Aliarcobacter cibarius]TLS98819.1 sulfite exporter TauE/SafE family protein [Aliarcobacter cibarius]TLS99614.1 sulfite exporter TauE/SafE family protein [Aliarcobacter cibarius]TLT04321.1 sulfite exporter TauE/SafE family protein [Aliarcobacter cibarius]
MELELIVFGLITGFTSGFFGIGGGSILIPMLLLVGFVMKEAVAISIMQMVFSSIYGSFLNSKKIKGLVRDGIILGIGAIFGGLVSGYFLPSIPNIYLQYIFIATLIYTIYTLFRAPASQDVEQEDKNIFLLIFIGFFVGIFAMSIGIGGSLMLLPILVRFLKYDLKVATALGLFFVIFSSIGGFISTSIYGNMLYYEGAIIGIGSVIGVYFGIKVKEKTKATSYKKFVLTLNLFVLIIMIYKTI